MEQGPVEQRIIEHCMRERLPLPKRIQDAPELWLGLELFYGAFLDLNSCRSSGWSLSPIPWTSIMDYAKAFEIEGEQKDDLFYFIRFMDEKYLEHLDKKNKK